MGKRGRPAAPIEADFTNISLKSDWDISVEVEVSKLCYVPSTLDPSMLYTLPAIKRKEAIAYGKRSKFESSVARSKRPVYGGSLKWK